MSYMHSGKQLGFLLKLPCIGLENWGGIAYYLSTGHPGFMIVPQYDSIWRVNLRKFSQNFVWAVRTTTNSNCRVSFIDLYLVFPTSFSFIFLRVYSIHLNQVFYGLGTSKKIIFHIILIYILWDVVKMVQDQIVTTAIKQSKRNIF